MDRETPLTTPAGQSGSSARDGTRTSLRAMTWKRFRRHRLALVGTALLVVIVLLSAAAPLFSRYDPNEINIIARNEPPSLTHLLGTDGTGRDVWTRLLYAGRVSLTMALVAVSLSSAIGILIGSLSGYYGGAVDMVLMRVTDTFMSLPVIIVAISLVAVLGPSLRNVVILFGILVWPNMARIVRGQFLFYREAVFVESSRALGASDARVILYHILPNAVGVVVVAATFDAGKAILLEAGLSFLGLGVQPPTPSWGNMINAARTVTTIEGLPWLWLPPGVMIVLTVLCLNFAGDGLRDALDPRSRR